MRRRADWRAPQRDRKRELGDGKHQLQQHLPAWSSARPAERWASNSGTWLKKRLKGLVFALNGLPVFVIKMNVEPILDHMDALASSQLAHLRQVVIDIKKKGLRWFHSCHLTSLGIVAVLFLLIKVHHLLLVVKPTNFHWGMFLCSTHTASMKLMCATVNLHLHFYQSMSAIFIPLNPAVCPALSHQRKSQSAFTVLPRAAAKVSLASNMLAKSLFFDISHLCLRKKKILCRRRWNPFCCTFITLFQTAIKENQCKK